MDVGLGFWILRFVFNRGYFYFIVMLRIVIFSKNFFLSKIRGIKLVLVDFGFLLNNI